MSIQSNFPAIKPTLLLDFANTKALDSRITFARASTARAYDGKTVAKAEENLLLRSQEFDNAAWVRDSLGVTANTTVAPDGTTTADTLAFADAAISRGYQAFTGNGSAFTFSVFAKYIDKQWIAFRLNDSGGTNRFVWFDVQNGVVGTTQAGITASIVASTEGFYRCIATIATTATSNFALIYGVNGDNSTSNVGQTGSVAAWGAQLEQRSAVTAYTPTTTQPITNYIPALQTAAAGVARFDHNPITGESLGLLIEEQRTNLLVRSEEFDNASWDKQSAAITANMLIAPDGSLTADKLIADNAVSLTVGNNSGPRARTTETLALGAVVTRTQSVFAKKGEFNLLAINIVDAGDVSRFARATFDLSAGTVTTSSATFTGVSASITPVGNGFFRCVLVYTTSALVGTFTRNAFNVSDSTATTGDGFSGIYIWGAQLEVGAFPTSYIPTVASQVTRSADAASMTGANFSSWYRADEGTIYTEGQINYAPIGGGGVAWYSIDETAASGSRAIQPYFSNGSGNLLSFVVSVVEQANTGNTAISANTNFKHSQVYKVNDFASVVNGGTVSTDTSGVVPVTVDRLVIGHTSSASNRSRYYKKFAYYPARVTNAQLQALTQN